MAKNVMGSNFTLKFIIKEKSWIWILNNSYDVGWWFANNVNRKKIKILPSVESQIKGGNVLDSPLIQKN